MARRKVLSGLRCEPQGPDSAHPAPVASQEVEPVRPLTQHEIIRMAAHRALLETQLVQALERDVFNASPFIDQLRDFVAQGIEHLAVLANRHPERISKVGDRIRVIVEVHEIQRILQSEKGLAVWTRHGGGAGATPEGLANIVQNWQRWEAKDCGDLIRLYAKFTEKGEWVEQRWQPPVSKEVRATQKAKRPHGELLWKQPKGGAGGVRARVLASTYGKPTPSHVKAGRQGILAMTGACGKTRGLLRWRLLPSSTVRKVDAVFGLAEGADISGTTANSSFFVKHVQNFFEQAAPVGTHFGEDLLPIVNMLPLASIVAQGHHSLLETAAALSVDPETHIHYRIGFFRTLMPRPRPRHPIAGRIGALLERFDARAWNYHMICYYGDDERLHGYLFDQPGDQRYFSKLARVDLSLMALFSGFPPRVREREVRRLAQLRGLPWPPNGCQAA